MTKRTARRYIERTLRVPKLIKLIPEELLENLANDTQANRSVEE